jgi:hypothetical protein
MAEKKAADEKLAQLAQEIDALKKGKAAADARRIQLETEMAKLSKNLDDEVCCPRLPCSSPPSLSFFLLLTHARTCLVPDRSQGDLGKGAAQARGRPEKDARRPHGDTSRAHVAGRYRGQARSGRGPHRCRGATLVP